MTSLFIKRQQPPFLHCKLYRGHFLKILILVVLELFNLAAVYLRINVI